MMLEHTDGEDRFLRAFPAKDMRIVSGQGSYLQDADGRRFMDLGGASQGVAITGHNHPKVVQAIRNQAAQLMHVAQTVPSTARARFLDQLHQQLGPRFTKTFLANSGTEANELAMKLAVAATGRAKFVACTGAFHGRTLGALSLTHRPAFREPFAPVLQDTSFAPYDQADKLTEHIGADTAAVFIEPVRGEGGIQVADASFLRAARELCDDHGAFLVFDEIQSGLCRTGPFLAATPTDVTPDIVTLGKGLAGGLPLAACSVTERAEAALPPGGHGSTYGGAPLACAAGSAVLRIVEEERLGVKANELGQHFIRRLKGIDDPRIRAVHGRGMMVGMDLRIRPQPVLAALESAGFLALSAGRSQLRFLPPLTSTRAELDAAADAVAFALGSTA